MSIIKCKMCGGDLRLEEGSTVCECEYCGTRQTVPSADNEKKLTLFSRAGRLLRSCEFDKAAGVFETIVADFPEEAEAYWGLVLCKYGIEYVDDPATGKKIPTCHRSSFDSVLDDPNFEQACENTDALARRVYRDEARQIEDLRKRIIEVSGKEEPYDVFISYKETDENGDRTLDSVIAQDIYTELTEKGYRVFFSRISLEDKLGTEYEPYIFAALNSAKVMLVVGTDYENFDSIWVKNEWSRFLKLIASGQKKTLIPVFKNMDAYDMPKEFAKLAAQDMGKVGAMQDLVRGVEKLVRKKTAPSPAQQPQQVIVQQSGGPNTVALLKRGQQALEDCNWDKAREFFDRVLDIDAENSDAFFGLFLSEARCINEENYINKVCAKNSQTEMLKLSPATERIEKIVKQYRVKDYLPENELRAMFQYDLGYPSCVKAKQNLAANEKQVFERDRNLARAIRYSKNEETARAIRFKARLFAELDAGIKRAKDQEIEAREAKQKSYEAFLVAAEKKAETKYQQALERLEENRRKQEEARQRELAEKEAARRKELAEQEAARKRAEEELERKYQTAIQKYDQAKTPAEYQKAKDSFLSLQAYKDSAAMAVQCDERIAAIKKAEAEEEERQRLLRERTERAKQAKKRRITVTLIALAGVAAAVFIVYTKIIVPGNLYKSAEALFESGKYEEAVAAFESLNGFKDSTAKIEEVKTAILERDYAAAVAIFENGDYDKAIAAFEALNGYRDSTAKITEAKEAINAQEYAVAEALLLDKNYTEALSAFKALGDYKDSSARVEEIREIIHEKKPDATLWNKDSLTGYMLPSTIAAGNDHTVSLREDGTVIATGANEVGQCNVSDWIDIVSVAAAGTHLVNLDEPGKDIYSCYTLGVKADGTVLATGNNDYGQCNVSGWRNIVAVAAADSYAVGLRTDGTVVATVFTGDQRGYYGQCEVSDWRDIVAVTVGGNHTVGLRADGTVVAVGSNGCGQCEVSAWTDIVAVAAGLYHTVGLRADGTVVATEYTGGKGGNNGQCEVSDWKDIIAISANYCQTIGLCANGTVVAVGSNYSGKLEVSDWENIVRISAGTNYTVGLRSDGTAVAVGYDRDGQCDVSDWTGIKLPDTAQNTLSSSDLQSEHNAAKNWTACNMFTAGYYFSACVHQDGTVSIIGGPSAFNEALKEAEKWRNIISVSGGQGYLVGLHDDGTAVITPKVEIDPSWFADPVEISNIDDKQAVNNWNEIIQISAGSNHVVGLCTDGTVVAAGNNRAGECNVSDWTNIVEVTAGDGHTAGLKNDGTVCAVGDNKYGQCDVEKWNNIIALAAGGSWTVGLRDNGTVVVAGAGFGNTSECSEWSDITAISVSISHIVGLKSDGTVVSTTPGEEFNKGQSNVSSWKNIVAVSAGADHTLGLCADGTVLAVGGTDYGQCNVSGWTDIKLPDAPETQVASSVTEPKSPFRIKPSLGVDVKKGTLNGVYLEKVSPDGPAAKAGVKENDLVMFFNSKKMESTQDFLDLYEQCSDGETIILELFPGGESHTVTVSLGTPKKLGIGALGTNSEGVGVVVSKVVPYSSAEKAGIQEGDMIFAIDEQRVLNIETYNMILDQYEVGDTVNVTIVRGNDELSADVTLEESGLAIFEDLPQSIDVEAGTSGALLSIRVAGNVDKNSIVWKGSYIIESNEDGSWIELTNVYTADSNVNTRGIRVDTQYDNDTDTYVSTLWADGISSEAAGNYYCRVEDGNGLTIQSSTVEVCVK